MKKIWFRNKEYGYGWYPATWQGWALTAGYIVMVTALAISLVFMIQSAYFLIVYFVSLFVLTGLFIYICYRTGEKPGWHWGKGKEGDRDGGSLPR